MFLYAVRFMLGSYFLTHSRFTWLMVAPLSIVFIVGFLFTWILTFICSRGIYLFFFGREFTSPASPWIMIQSSHSILLLVQGFLVDHPSEIVRDFVQFSWIPQSSSRQAFAAASLKWNWWRRLRPQMHPLLRHGQSCTLRIVIILDKNYFSVSLGSIPYRYCYNMPHHIIFPMPCVFMCTSISVAMGSSFKVSYLVFLWSVVCAFSFPHLQVRSFAR